MNDIVISRLNKAYGEKNVLRDLNLILPGGKITCLMGPSGCGKTTFASVLLGIIPPDSGTVSGMPGKCAAVFQEDRLCEELSVLSNLRFACGRRLSAGGAREVLSSLGLDCELHTPVNALSGGMKRRVALARALVADWDFLLLDEPFKGLDDALRRRCIGVISARSKGKTVLCITHDAEDAALFSAEIVCL